MSFTIDTNFIDSFKIGDNINYNLEVLDSLYTSYDLLPNSSYLIKPIVIINTSIIEAILYDFVVNRLKKPYSTEILFLDIFELLRNKDLKKFEHYITQAEKFDLFALKDTSFYDAIRKLASIRNRIHIQNDKFELPADEDKLFNLSVKILSEKVLEKILDTMTKKYPRRPEYHQYVKDFKLPWVKHFNH